MIKLRPIRKTDAKKYLECHQDIEAKKNFSKIPITIKQAEEEIKPDRFVKKFAIMEGKDFAGFLTIKLNNHPTYKHSAIIGYGVHQDYRGKGIATKALKKGTSYAFNIYKLKRISGWCRAHNIASQKVLEKAGYNNEGTLRKNKFINGKYLDDQIWSKVK